MVRIRFPDGEWREYSPGVTPLEIARELSEGLARKSLGAVYNGEMTGLDRGLTTDGELRLLTDRDPEALDILRHTAAHVLAQAVKRHRPEAQLGFGPAIEEGFYYDFLVEKPFTPEDLATFEEEMRRIMKEDLPVKCEVLSRGEIIAKLRELGEELKIAHVEELSRAHTSKLRLEAPPGEEELRPPSAAQQELRPGCGVEELQESILGEAPPSSAWRRHQPNSQEEERLTCYTQGEFTDVCRGPHLPSTGRLKHFKLLSTSGAYWKGDEKNPMLQRIYGTAFFSKEALEAHLRKLEEARERDHRRLGRELDLFMLSEDAGAGLAIFKPNGAMILNLLKKFVEGELLRRGYDLVLTPHLFKEELFVTSGHLTHYLENMFRAKHAAEEQGYVVKPMNCPGHILIYKSDLRSYRDLPMRLFEFGTCYRFERSGTLHGLTRVRNLTIDDAHHFCTPDQLQGELLGLFDFADFVFRTLGFEYRVKLATRPADSIGSDENWAAATVALENALRAIGWEFRYDPGGGAFYGPKVDIWVKDAIGRDWQLSTIQVDFNLPERFELEYVDENGGRQRPRVVHRAIIGSLERFLGVYIEHTAGAFPVWLAPEQARVLPISEKTNEYAEKVAATLKRESFRVRSDLRNEKVGFKIREGRLRKIPYLLVVGPKEVEDGTVSVNERIEGDTGAVPLEEFLKRLEREGRIPSSDN